MPQAGQASPENSAFLRACRRQPADRVPVWFMRQAGRSLPEYRALRGDGPILDAVAKPELAAELTLQPVRRYGVDAAILFSDIVVPVAAVGFGVDVVPGVGPVTERPFRSEKDLTRLRPLEPEVDIPYVLEAVRILVAELEVPLIGFAGAPFTVASYLIEGRPSRDYALTKTLMRTDPVLWRRLLDALAGTALVSLDEARRRVGPQRAVQGNLDPVVCLAPWEVVAAEARRVLERAGGQAGHVFNLGHGVMPQTDPDTLHRVVDLVHQEGVAGQPK